MDRDFKQYHRGDIYFANLDPHYGSEQGGIRPVLIVQNDSGNRYSPTLVVAAATKRTDKKPYLPTHVILNHIPGMEYDGDSMFLLEQLYTIDKHRIKGFAGRITEEQQRKVNVGLAASLGLEDMNDGNVKIPRPVRKKRSSPQGDPSMLFCLCPTCRSKFFDTKQYYIIRADRKQKDKDVCTYCQTRMGYDYYVLPYDWEDRQPTASAPQEEAGHGIAS
ncbi:MAG: type II toxin-antitoxin system PemK/MazF family toxin [Clostridiales bacterium]|nr:type II toxin-antitoxin system PemK/MazF family toxin [Clostridiales bacterium]